MRHIGHINQQDIGAMHAMTCMPLVEAALLSATFIVKFPQFLTALKDNLSVTASRLVSHFWRILE
jgi:hypothetical protein